jgi:mono/diheme cytochrome c family protein
MMRPEMKKFSIITALAFLALMLPAMAHAWPWSWDMYHQRNHRAQEEPAPPQPEGIVSIEGKPFFAKDRAEAAGLKNPIAPDTDSIKKGRVLYRTYCLPCHGATGHGDGLVGKKYIPPTDLTSDYVQNKPDGDIFFTITNGGLAVMPSYGDSVAKMDRWHIVNYILHELTKEKTAGK